VDDSSISISVVADGPGAPDQPVLMDWVHDQEVQFLHFNLEADLVVGVRYAIEMAFTGTMKPSTQGQGLYWDSYLDENEATV